jgi:hypothetical protein
MLQKAPAIAGFVSTMIAATLPIAGCIAPAAERLAARSNLERTVVRGGDFEHLILKNDGGGDTLHVFIEGDGTPWIGGRRVASDPTPRNPLALRLMLATPAAAAYVGRPCYFSVEDPTCDSRYWTDARYAPSVVASMAAAIGTLIADDRYRRCIVIGHSGGAALAVLVAGQLPRPCRIVSIAGLIDAGAWTQWHRYEPLTGSLDPRDVDATRSDRFVYLVGMRDTNIPAEQTLAAIDGAPEANVWRYPDFDHVCCWLEQWPQILERLRELPMTAPAGQRAGIDSEQSSAITSH